MRVAEGPSHSSTTSVYEPPLAESLRALSASVAGPGQVALATALNRELRQVRAGHDAAQVAELLTKHLETSLTTDLVDEQGRSCRVEAVAALLRLGHPWALTIQPEDLVWYRRESRKGSPRPRWWPGFVAGALVLAATGWLAVRGADVPAPPREIPAAPEHPPPPRPPVPQAKSLTSTELMSLPTFGVLGGASSPHSSLVTSDAEVFVTPDRVLVRDSVTLLSGGRGTEVRAVSLYTEGGQLVATRSSPVVAAPWKGTSVELGFQQALPPGTYVVVTTVGSADETVTIRTDPVAARVTWATLPGGAVLTARQASIEFVSGRGWVLRGTFEGPPGAKVVLGPVSLSEELSESAAVTTASPVASWRDDGLLHFEATLPQRDPSLAYRVGVAVGEEGARTTVWFQPEAVQQQHNPLLALHSIETTGGLGATTVSVETAAVQQGEVAVRLAAVRASRPIEITRLRLCDTSGQVLVDGVPSGTLPLRASLPVPSTVELRTGQYVVVVDVRDGTGAARVRSETFEVTPPAPE